MESINWTIVFGIVGILGFIGTFYFGFWPRRAKGRNSQLKYVTGEFFNVYKTLLSGKFNLEIKHKGIPINNNIYYISGKLVVKGDDINTVGNEITIELPEGCKWIETDKESSHPDINPEFEKNETIPNKAILTFNKLRREDHIIISGIIEGYQLSDDLHNKIRFSHRIDDTDDVKVVDFEALHEKWTSICIIPFALSFCCFGLNSQYSFLRQPFWNSLFLLFVMLSGIGILVVTRKLILHTYNVRHKHKTLSKYKLWAINSAFIVGIVFGIVMSIILFQNCVVLALYGLPLWP